MGDQNLQSCNQISHQSPAGSQIKKLISCPEKVAVMQGFIQIKVKASCVIPIFKDNNFVLPVFLFYFSYGDLQVVPFRRPCGTFCVTHFSNSFLHYLEYGRGVVILFKNSLELKVTSVQPDKEGCFTFLDPFVQDQKFLFVNIYAPNKTSEQTLFLDQSKEDLDKSDLDNDIRIIHVIGVNFKWKSQLLAQVDAKLL